MVPAAPRITLLDRVVGRVANTDNFKTFCEDAFSDVDHNLNNSLSTTELHLAGGYKTTTRTQSRRPRTTSFQDDSTDVRDSVRDG
jgi:hypothetical protein